MSLQAMARWLGGAKKVALLLAGLAAVAALGLASAASAATVSNNNGITINDDANPDCAVPGTATPYPSEIAVSGLDSSISDVNVSVSGLSHSSPDDVGLLLVSPTGQSTLLMTDSGGFSAVLDINLTFDDAASGFLPNGPFLSSGTYKPSAGASSVGCVAPGSFPGAPATPYASSLSVFNGTNPNGTWKLYVIDDSGGDAGAITGWSLDISTADTTPPTVTTSTPTNKADNVTATFSEEVQNVTPSTFFLERQIAVKKAPPKFVLVDATVSLNDEGIYVLDPVGDLPKGNYRATITTDVTDLADNALGDPVVWTFTVKK